MPSHRFGRPLRHRLATLFGLSTTLIVTALGCGGDTPRAGSLDVGASKKAAEANGTVPPFGLGSKSGDVRPTRAKADAKTTRQFLPEKGKKGSK